MNITKDVVDGLTIIVVSGDIDTVTSPGLQEVLSKEVEDGTINHIIDLCDTRYISSMGLRVLLNHLKKIKKLGGKFIISGCNPLIEEIFEISGFLQYFSLASSRKDALNLANA